MTRYIVEAHITVLAPDEEAAQSSVESFFDHVWKERDTEAFSHWEVVGAAADER